MNRETQKHIGKGLSAVTALGLSLAGLQAVEGGDALQFEKDRKAILAMAGKYKVTFRFHETYSLDKDYQIKEKKYHESAHELVKVVEDSGKRIVLQHLLLVDDGLEVMVIKHWGQVWKYEDTEILEYQQGTTWKKKILSEKEVKGTWSQYVTQTDDSPRYEGIGRWDHSGGSSSWASSLTPRPLPRREYTKRKDYDVLMAVNTHVITPHGWVHEQTNRKMVKRDGQERYLCAERGFNTYEKVTTAEPDFSKAERNWAKTQVFWKLVRDYWNAKIDRSQVVSYQRKINGVSMGKAVRKLTEREKGELTPAVVSKVLDTYVECR